MIYHGLNMIDTGSKKTGKILIVALLILISMLLLGNVKVLAEKNTATQIGIDVPELVITVDPSEPDGLNGEYFKIPIITLTKTNDDSGDIYYKWDNGSEQLYNGPITALSGQHRLTAYIRDGFTNVGTIQRTLNVNPHQRLTKTSAGHEYTLMVREDGTVWGWGSNYYGNLGNGTTALGNEYNIPTQAVGLTNIIEVESGYYHSLALKSDGTVWAWGSSQDQGLLGNGTTDRSITNTPIQVPNLTDVVDISIGSEYSLVLKADGTVWSWGDNTHGQLGDGTNHNKSMPVQVNGLTNVVAVECGGAHSLALKSDGTIWAWGNNSYGQLGIGSYVEAVSTPTQTKNPVGATGHLESEANFIAIASSISHSLGLRSDGTVWAWGNNRNERLGLLDPYFQENERIPRPRKVGNLSEVNGIYSGGERSMALKSDGSLWVWGINWHGQLGDGTKEIRSAPVIIPTISGLSAISTGSEHTVVMKTDNTIWGWGKNATWQLGDRSSIEDRLAPVQVDFSPFTSPIMENTRIATSDTGSLYIKSDSTLLQWGNNSSYKENITLPHGAISVSGGKEHFLALTSVGTVWAWGNNSYGQLGNGSFSDAQDPVQVSSLTDIIGISAGEYHSMALKSDGTVWTWGLNGGRLGNGTTGNRNTPVMVTGLNDVVAIAGGGGHSLALKASGEVWGWGKNDLGQIKVDPTAYQHQDIDTRILPVRIEGLNYVISISGGKNHSMAIKCDGTAYAWGDNTYGQCSVNSHGRPTFARIIDFKEVEYRGHPVTMSVPVTDTLDIAGGESHSLIIRSNGSVWALGNNENGQLGIGATEYVDDYYRYNKYTPQELTTMSGIVDIISKTNHSLAMSSDGALWAWGVNEDGQLGDGTSENSNIPLYIDVLPPRWDNNSTINANQLTSSSLTLDWTAASDDLEVSEYIVNTYDEDGAIIGTYNTTNNSLNIEGLSAGIDYAVEIYALDHAGNKSEELIGQALIEQSEINNSPTLQLVTVIELVASDPDGDVITISLGDDAPSFVKLVGNRLLFESTAQVGTFTFSILVEDGRGGETSQNITITSFGNSSPAGSKLE